MPRSYATTAASSSLPTQLFDNLGNVTVDGNTHQLEALISGVTTPILTWDTSPFYGIQLLTGSVFDANSSEIDNITAISGVSGGTNKISVVGGFDMGDGYNVDNIQNTSWSGASSGHVTMHAANNGNNNTLILPSTTPTATQVMTATGVVGTVTTLGWSTPLTKASIAGSLGITFQGNGSTISVGTKSYIVYFPYSGTITSATLLSDTSGSIAIDIWKVAYATVPTIANTIVASAPPTLSSAQVSRDTTLTGWSKTVTAGDNWIFNVNSATTVQTVTLTLEITRT